MLVKGVSDLQLTDEHCHRNVFVAFIYQSHLALEITDVMLDALLELHLDGEKVIVVLFEFASGCELIVEGLPHLLEVSKRVAQKRVESVGGDPHKAGGSRLMRRANKTPSYLGNVEDAGWGQSHRNRGRSSASRISSVNDGT